MTTIFISVNRFAVMRSMSESEAISFKNTSSSASGSVAAHVELTYAPALADMLVEMEAQRLPPPSFTVVFFSQRMKGSSSPVSGGRLTTPRTPATNFARTESRPWVQTQSLGPGVGLGLVQAERERGVTTGLRKSAA